MLVVIVTYFYDYLLFLIVTFMDRSSTTIMVGTTVRGTIPEIFFLE